MTKNKKGFTIIEVVLVLAIAGLIFLMVFIALPALQRSQRNTRRRSDMSRFVAAVTEYQAGNDNKLPFIGAQSSGSAATYDDETTDWVKKYIMAGNNEQFMDPDGNYYAITKGMTGMMSYSGNPATGDASSFVRSALYAGHHVIIAYPKHSCGDSEGYITQASGNNFCALMMELEGGAINCVDNQ